MQFRNSITNENETLNTQTFYQIIEYFPPILKSTLNFLNRTYFCTEKQLSQKYPVDLQRRRKALNFDIYTVSGKKPLDKLYFSGKKI